VIGIKSGHFISVRERIPDCFQFIVLNCVEDIEAIENTEAQPKAKSVRHIYKSPDGRLINLKGYDKFQRDILSYWHGATLEYNVDVGKKKPIAQAMVTVFDPANPVGPEPLEPSADSPICKKCMLHATGCKHPFMQPVGAANPIVTIVYEHVTQKEDAKGQIGIDGYPGMIAKIIHQVAAHTGVKLSDVRWFPLTLCANASKVKVDYKIKGNWCRYHLIDDLMRHPPRLIVPVGTAVLGMLCHKSNAQDWQGKLLTYRGWPDDWLTNRAYMLGRPHPLEPDKKFTGHPAFGKIPKVRIPMMPIQSPYIVFGSKNQIVVKRWIKQIEAAMMLIKEGVKPKVYTRPWYRFTKDPEEAATGLREIIANPGMLVCYDTETTGLKPWSFHAECKSKLPTPPKIVSMMFRWTDPATDKPRSIGFPWDYEQSPMKSHIAALTPIVTEALQVSKLIGHNLTFDVLYTFATLYAKWMKGWNDPKLNRLRDGWLCALADAAHIDTWHAAYTYMQKSGSLGLEVITYDWAPGLAGYEEDMTLLIELHREALHPGENKGGHYLNCSEKYWPTHVIPYVMGDVESCYTVSQGLMSKLKLTDTDPNKRYEIPLAKPGSPGKFRLFRPPSRDWVYKRVMSPAASVLMKIMGRGMFVDLKELNRLEGALPKTITELRTNFRVIDPNITRWCEEQERQIPGWELDLENKTQLKELLYTVLNLPVQRLTKGGKKFYGEDPLAWESLIYDTVKKRLPDATTDELAKAAKDELIEFAATDKFTLNRMAVDHAHVRPLQDYRKVYKLYSTYIRPLRNITVAGIDKKARVKEPHLCYDNCIHASFMLTGTRGGRLSCRDPNLQQLPRDGEVKSLYVSRFGDRGCMYQGDLSQIELRLMASACGDPTMVKAYFDEVDLHTLTTSRIFNTPYEHFSKAYMKELQDKGRDKEAKELSQKRNIGKTVNFLTGYGGGAFGLQNVLAAKSIYLTLEECEKIIASFFDSYPSLQKMLMFYKHFIMERHVAVSVFGRVRVFEEVQGEDKEAISKALRAGCNHLIQSTASDMMLLALIAIEQLMREADLESMLVSTVHDSLLVDSIRDELPKIHEITTSVLNNFPMVLPAMLGEDFDTSWMLVPFTGDCEVGLDYLSAKAIPKDNIDWDKLLAPHA
jgi:DNA polymerase I-like protein with 3'-5' exonuclease and polymerase domains